MSRKEECIMRIDQLIKLGSDVLKSKGPPVKKLDRNRMAASTAEERLCLTVATYEEKQDFYEANKQRFTKTYTTIDYEQSLDWTNQVLICLMNCLGEKHYIISDIMSIKKF